MSIISNQPENKVSEVLPFEQTSVFGAIASLAVAVISLSLAAIFVKLSEQEISPNALVFHRLWIATLIFGIGNQLKTRGQQKSQDSPTVRR